MNALEGLLVLDISEIYQGPLTAQILGDFGANVIKIERPGRGALERPLDRYGTAEGLMSCYYTAGNRNKRSITLDLKKPEARQALIETPIAIPAIFALAGTGDEGCVIERTARRERGAVGLHGPPHLPREEPVLERALPAPSPVGDGRLELG